MKVTKARQRWRRRRWEDRQLLAGHDPRVLIELQAIADRVHSDRSVDAALGRSAWGVGPRAR